MAEQGGGPGVCPMRERVYLVVLVVLAAAMFGGLAGFLTLQQRAALARGAEAVGDQDSLAGAAPAMRPIEDVARLVCNLKLVTVELITLVDSSKLDQSWRGDVRASVRAPVRMLYGCDLSGVVGSIADVGAGPGAWLRPNLLTGGYTLRVPRPERLAAEINGSDEKTEVRVGWGRFRDVAGEYQLGLARAGLHDAVQRLTTTPEQQRQIEELTRGQLTALVQAIAGEDQAVSIEFFDVAPDHVAGTPDGDR